MPYIVGDAHAGRDHARRAPRSPVISSVTTGTTTAPPITWASSVHGSTRRPSSRRSRATRPSATTATAARSCCAPTGTAPRCSRSCTSGPNPLPRDRRRPPGARARGARAPSERPPRRRCGARCALRSRRRRQARPPRARTNRHQTVVERRRLLGGRPPRDRPAASTSATRTWPASLRDGAAHSCPPTDADVISPGTTAPHGPSSSARSAVISAPLRSTRLDDDGGHPPARPRSGCGPETARAPARCWAGTPTRSARARAIRPPPAWRAHVDSRDRCRSRGRRPSHPRRGHRGAQPRRRRAQDPNHHRAGRGELATESERDCRAGAVGRARPRADDRNARPVEERERRGTADEQPRRWVVNRAQARGKRRVASRHPAETACGEIAQKLPSSKARRKRANRSERGSWRRCEPVAANAATASSLTRSAPRACGRRAPRPRAWARPLQRRPAPRSSWATRATRARPRPDSDSRSTARVRRASESSVRGGASSRTRPRAASTRSRTTAEPSPGAPASSGPRLRHRQQQIEAVEQCPRELLSIPARTLGVHVHCAPESPRAPHGQRFIAPMS